MRQLFGITTARRNAEKMRAALVVPSLAVEPVPKPINRPHRRDTLILELPVFGLRVVRRADFGREHDRAAIRRPARVAGAVSEPGQLPGLATIGRQHPELRLADAALAFLLVLGLDVT